MQHVPNPPFLMNRHVPFTECFQGSTWNAQAFFAIVKPNMLPNASFCISYFARAILLVSRRHTRLMGAQMCSILNIIIFTNMFGLTFPRNKVALALY